MLLGLLLTLNILVCLALIGVVLLQRSEGGALGTGGSPTGLITTRGAGDLLTRTTWVLFVIFLSLSLALTLLGGRARSDQATVDSLKSLTINPDAKRKSPSALGTAPATPPGQTLPAPVQLPPLGGTGSASRVAHPEPTRAPRLTAPPAERRADSPAPPTPGLTLPPLAGGPQPTQAPVSNSPKPTGPSS
jgi:preprotein translocase subunit SecG